MGEDDVILVDLSGLDNLSEESDNAATADAMMEQQEVHDVSDDANNQENMDIDTDNMAALSIPMAATGSDSSGPLPIPPQASDGEKVDTSQLDAELAKIKAISSGNANLSTPSASQTQKNHLPTQLKQAADSAMPKSQENLISKQKNGGTSIMDDNEREPMQSREENIHAMDDKENNEKDPEENASESITEISGENHSMEDENNAEINESKEDDDDDVSRTSTDDTVQINDATAVDGGENSIDPQFAEKTIQDIHADTQAPHMDNLLAEQIHSLEAQQVNYEQPAVEELAKQSTLAKNTNIYSSIPLEKMSIVLTFETGRQKITIGELEKVKEGYTFECGNSIEAPVTICANDMPIGTGELLDIDGRIGVRIIEFYNK
ncbi:MAG: FliM/FliN family flagellar motor switch protein [Puniceicoccales bacterium]|jgi:flagellar motor switch/type III secretory pathway protein FliN|nr:FliM/FliN family flagellar motor switch protein [Puniceicoccales bacterium]